MLPLVFMIESIFIIKRYKDIFIFLYTNCASVNRSGPPQLVKALYQRYGAFLFLKVILNLRPTGPGA